MEWYLIWLWRPKFCVWLSDVLQNFIDVKLSLTLFEDLDGDCSCLPPIRNLSTVEVLG